MDEIWVKVIINIIVGIIVFVGFFVFWGRSAGWFKKGGLVYELLQERRARKKKAKQIKKVEKDNSPIQNK